EDVAGGGERHAPEIEVLRLDARLAAPGGELFELADGVAALHVHERRLRRERRRAVAVAGDEDRDGADAAVGSHARPAGAAGDFPRCDGVEAAVEENRAIGGKHPALRLKAEAALAPEGDAFAGH